MTVSSTRGTKITHDDLVLQAWKYAGMADVQAGTADADMSEKLKYGRQQLDIIIDQLASQPDARNTDFYDLTCVDDQQTYTLPDEIVDVVGDGKYVRAGYTTSNAPSELMVKQIRREQWQSLSSRSTKSTPLLMYPHRGTEDSYAIVVYLWPRPSEAGTIRLMVQRAPGDALVGSDTLDLKSAWYDYVLHELAARLCMSSNGSMERAASLKMEAKRLKREARIYGAQHGPIPIQIALTPVQRSGEGW